MSFQKTPIEYLTHTWNPITMRCTPVSPGCANCWHLRICHRLAANPTISYTTQRRYKGELPPIIKTGDNHIPKGPGRRIGVQFMGDLFHESIDFISIRNVINFGPVEHAKDVFLMLTKRPEIALAYIQWASKTKEWTFAKLPNVWLGVTAENQEQADKRIPVLLQIPAAMRFVSVEPMLTKIDLTMVSSYELSKNHRSLNALTGIPYDWDFDKEVPEDIYSKLDWVICGAETGPGKRPMDIWWAIDLQAQCIEAGVPFFFKKDSNGQWPEGLSREYPR